MELEAAGTVYLYSDSFVLLNRHVGQWADGSGKVLDDTRLVVVVPNQWGELRCSYWLMNEVDRLAPAFDYRAQHLNLFGAVCQMPKKVDLKADRHRTKAARLGCNTARQHEDY